MEYVDKNRKKKCLDNTVKTQLVEFIDVYIFEPLLMFIFLNDNRQMLIELFLKRFLQPETRYKKDCLNKSSNAFEKPPTDKFSHHDKAGKI